MQKQRGISVRFKLILTSLALIFGVLGILGLLAHQWDQSLELGKIDTFLITDISATASAISTRLPSVSENDPAIQSFLESQEFTAFLSNYLDKRLNRPAIYKTTLAIFDRQDKKLVSSNDAFPVATSSITDFGSTLSDQSKLPDGSQLITITKSGLVYRIIIMPIWFQQQPVLSLHLACLLTPAFDATRDFDRTILMVLGVIGLFASLGSVLLITRTLRPVNKMRLAAEGITEHNLDARIPVTDGHDEISQLSHTFNHLLSRIEEAYHYQVQLVEDLSHQLKTPITILRSSIDLALHKKNDPEATHRVLEDSLADIDRLSSFLVTMLSLARLESKSVPLNLEKVSLFAMLAGMIEDMEPLWQENHLHFVFDLNMRNKSLRRHAPFTLADRELAGFSEAFSLQADRVLLSQTFINILSNAFKFCPVDGEIGIYLQVEDTTHPGRFRIVISNTGAPIPPETIDLIFERFYSREVNAVASGEETKSSIPDSQLYSQGFGLGLSIARNIVGLHNGTIRAYNPIGGGAAFEVILPMEPPK